MIIYVTLAVLACLELVLHQLLFLRANSFFLVRFKSINYAIKLFSKVKKNATKANTF